MRKFLNINTIYQASNNLTKLNSTFEVLNQLNSILATCLPENLVTFCHAGAIDSKKSIVVVFVSQQEAFHLIRNLGSHILQTFNNNNFAFENILIKFRQITNNNDQTVKYKKLEPKLKDKLISLANSLGKPELVKSDEELQQQLNTDEQEIEI